VPEPATTAVPDRIHVGIRYLGHATVLVELPGLRFITDPLFAARLGPLSRHGPVPSPSEVGPVDLVLVSHAHPDHFHAQTLRELEGDPVVIVPTGLGRAARRTGRRVTSVRRGDRIDLGQWTIRVVPARHWRWPFEAVASTVGYVVEGPVRIYFAGDTAHFRALASTVGPVDVALLPVGSWGPHRTPGHLDPTTAARVASAIDARVAVPIHWGTFFPPGLDAIWPGRLFGPGPRFAAEAARLAPDTSVAVLLPGATFSGTLPRSDSPDDATAGPASRPPRAPTQPR
jgi:L-ascorbate metabolism protein UlaG (beta-lactamase superfamily)